MMGRTERRSTQVDRRFCSGVHGRTSCFGVRRKKPAAFSRDGLSNVSTDGASMSAPYDRMQSDLLGLLCRVRDGVATLRNILAGAGHRVATGERGGRTCNEKQSD